MQHFRRNNINDPMSRAIKYVTNRMANSFEPVHDFRGTGKISKYGGIIIPGDYNKNAEAMKNKPSLGSFNIKQKDIPEMLSVLESAASDDHLWFAYKNTSKTIHAKDVFLFKSGADADEFVQNQKPLGKNYTALPIEATQQVLENLSPTETLIIRDIKEIIKLQNENNFKHSAKLMEDTVSRLYWKEMEPKAFLHLLTDLKTLHAESLRGKELVEQLFITHWPDLVQDSKTLFTNNSISHFMNEKNLDYLSNQLKYTGFGEDLQQQLKDKIQKDETEFSLFHQRDFGKDSTVATLHFRKSDNSDLYFFNRYTLLVKTPQANEPVKQSFYINQNESNVTLKEGYNLLSGRAVDKELTNKQDEKYHAWLQIDFKNTNEHGNYAMKQFHDKYGFDLKMVLDKHPIKELSIPSDRERLIDSLERGNRQSVTIVVGGNESKVFIEASPQFKSINFYDDSMKRVQSKTLYEKLGVPAGEKNNVSEKVEGTRQNVKSKPGEEDEGPGQQQQKKSKRRGQKIS